ncbi:MAG: hypothetical protein HY301_10000 [Verrucomicrobia bacterium]|nr:hypothetical protein [Verrucomicrobiota bacterium]
MIHLRRCSALAAVCLASLIAKPAQAQPASPSLASVRVGEISPATFTAPFDFTAVDPDATAALRAKEAARLPVIVRVKPDAATDAAAALRTAFIVNRERFTATLATEFGKGKLTDAETEGEPFTRFRTKLREDLAPFPLDAPLAKTWAMGRTADQTLTTWAARLEAARRGKHLRPDALPPEAWNGPPQARLLPAAFDAARLAANAAPSESELVPLTDLAPISRARAEFIAANDPETPRGVNEFLATLLEPDCEFDLALTRRLRDERTTPLRVTLHYERGQTIVTAGGTVTPQVKAVLEQLAAQMPLATAPTADAERRERLTTALLAAGAAALLLVLLFLGLWRWSRARHVSEEVVIVDEQPSLPVLAADATPVERARAGMMELVRDRFVVALLAQRRGMIDAQRVAQAELADLEARLERLHAPLQERLDIYEKRIAELEADLERRGQENRELLQATITLMQQKMEEEKAEGPRVKMN